MFNNLSEHTAKANRDYRFAFFVFLSVGLDFEEVKEDGGIVMDLVMGGIQ